MPRLSFKPRAVRVFLSSTFRDFGEERDLLVRKVFPTLRARLAERFVDLVDVDLRWGITEAEAEQGEVLPICLAEIDRARPFFIGLLGERYGWIPPTETYPPAVLEQHPWLEEHRGGKSVTELEILHGVLNNPAMAGRAMFYFRSPDYAKTKGGDYVALSAQDQAKQDALKDRVRGSAFPVVENYATPEDVAERIQEDLWSALEIEFPATEVPDAFTRDLLQHEAYAAPRRRIYLGGETYLEALDQALKDNTQWILLNGESGSGKSALLANWIEGLTDEDLITHVHYVGANPSATDPVAMVRRIIEWIRRETNTEDEPASDPQELLDSLPEWLSRASAWASLNNTRFLLILDALNGISDRRDLRWFPSFLPAHVQCVVSTLPGEVRDNLADKAPWHTIEVHPLDAKTARQVFITYLGLYNKTLPDPLIDQVMDHPLVTNPLFLMTLAEELRLFGEHEQLSQQLAHYQESLTVDDLFERVLARVEADHGAAIIRQIMTALWASRSGLREEELLAYTSLPLMKWSYIRHALGPALIESNGRYVFAHDYLRIAVSDRYMAGNNTLEDDGQSDEALTLRQDAHIRLAEWFQAHAFQDDETISEARAAEEIPYQWFQAKQWEQLATTLTQLEMFQAIAEHREQQEHLAYWLAIEAQTEITLDQAYERAWTTWNLDRTVETTGDTAQQLAKLLEYAGRYADFTVSLAQLALDITETVYGSDHPRTGTRLNEVAELLRHRGSYDAAENLNRRALIIIEQALGPSSPEAGTCINDIAVILEAKGDLDAAEPMLRRALEIDEQAFGPDHPNTALSLNNLAHLLQQKGEHGTAQLLYERAIGIAKNALGELHTSTATYLDNLSALLSDTGDYDAAEQMGQRALEITKELLGPDHPDTGIRLNNLAHLLTLQGDYGAAESLLRDALEITEKALGSDHRDMGIRLGNLAHLLSLKGDYDAAQPLLERALKITEKVLGPEHPSTSLDLNNLALFLRDKGDLDAAEPLYRRALAITEKSLGLDHNQTGLILCNLADLLENRGDLEAAEPLYRRALKITETVLGPDHPSTGTSLNNLAGLLEDKGDLEAAEPMYRRALEIRERALGPDHPHTAMSLNNLADLLENKGDLESAEPLYSREITINEKNLGPDHPGLARDLQNYGVLLRSLERYDEALDILNRALAINEKNTGPDSEEVASALSALGKLFELQGKYEDSLQSYSRARTIRENLVGPLHPDTARLYFRLGELELTRGNKTAAKEAFKKAWDAYEDAYGSEDEDSVVARNAYENC